MQHIAAIKAINLQVQIVQKNLLVTGRRFVQHNEQVIFHFFTNLLTANLSFVFIGLEQAQEIAITIDSAM